MGYLPAIDLSACAQRHPHSVDITYRNVSLPGASTLFETGLALSPNGDTRLFAALPDLQTNNQLITGVTRLAYQAFQHYI